MVDFSGHLEGCATGGVFAVEEAGLLGEEEVGYAGETVFDCLVGIS